DGRGNITDVDVSIAIHSQPVVSIYAGSNPITTSAIAIEIQDLNSRSLLVQNHNSVIAHRDLRRRYKFSAAISVPVPAYTFENIALQIQDKDEVAWRVGEI